MSLDANEHKAGGRMIFAKNREKKFCPLGSEEKLNLSPSLKLTTLDKKW